MTGSTHDSATNPHHEQDTNQDMIDVLSRDHRTLDSLLQEIETTTTSPEHRRQLADHVITELARLLVTEQKYLYPAVGRYLPDGSAITARAERDHAGIERVMAELENISPAHSQFELLLSTLTADARKYDRFVLEELLPRLEQAVPPAERRELGEQVVRVKQIAPTRPHPANPDRPPATLVLDPGAPLVQSVKSALSGQH